METLKLDQSIQVLQDHKNEWGSLPIPRKMDLLVKLRQRLGERGEAWVEGDSLPHEEEFKTLLYIPKGKRLLALIPIGVPEEWPTIEKRPLESILHWQVY